MTTHRPLVEDLTERAEILGVVEEIAHALEPDSVWEGPRATGLSGGRAGGALFFNHLARCLPGRGYEEVSERLLDAAFDRAEAHHVSLYGGLSGVAESRRDDPILEAVTATGV